MNRCCVAAAAAVPPQIPDSFLSHHCFYVKFLWPEFNFELAWHTTKISLSVDVYFNYTNFLYRFFYPHGFSRKSKPLILKKIKIDGSYDALKLYKMAEDNGKMDIEALKQKALKITEALYRTTDILFDGEPLKWSLRQTALEIMGVVSNLNSAGQMREVDRLNVLIQNLFLKLELASSGTYISKMNFEVLRREYSLLNNGILEQSKTPILLDIPNYRTQEQISDIISDRIETDKDKEEKIEINLDRKTVIVSALKDSGPSSVSDVAKLFNGTIGEKTVQRELNSLVEVGAIKKEGEKRWRRYFL